MNANHAANGPRPEFRAHLEWQIESALRREARFAEPSSKRLPRLGSALALLAAMAIGAVGAAAQGGLAESRERDELVSAVKSEQALARMRLDLARAGYDEAKRKVDVGAASRSTLQLAETQLEAIESAMKKLALDVEEIQATAKAPRNDLQAPLVGRRDFVSERLTLDLAAVQHALVAAERDVENTRQRFNVGVANAAALRQAEADLAQAHARMQQLQEMLILRRRAASGELKGDEIAAALRRTDLTVQRARAERELDLARARIEEVRRLVAVGGATSLELKRTEVEVLELELELKRVRQELEKLAAARRE